MPATGVMVVSFDRWPDVATGRIAVRLASCGRFLMDSEQQDGNW